jgi:hypothetical protein
LRFARLNLTPRAAGVVFWSAILIGAALRFVVASRGHNYDVDSYRIVAEILQRGGNVYSETSRYNYGPIWFILLGLFQAAVTVLHLPADMFRGFIIALLVVTDIGIALFLRRNFRTRAAVLFFLNPVSIIITGYHNQFENIPILTGLLAARVFDTSMREKSELHLRCPCLLGLSLVLKHILFLFPLWLALKPGQKLRDRLTVLVLPALIFLLAFVPFWSAGREGILRNVFGYRSLENAPLLHVLAPSWLAPAVAPMFLFLSALIIGAVVFRRSGVESLLLYSFMLVIFAPAIANQYLVIPIAAMAVFPNWLFGIYTLLTTLYLSADSNGFYFVALEPYLPAAILSKKVGLHAWDPLILCLFLGFLWMLFADRMKSLLPPRRS